MNNERTGWFRKSNCQYPDKLFFVKAFLLVIIYFILCSFNKSESIFADSMSNHDTHSHKASRLKNEEKKGTIKKIEIPEIHIHKEPSVDEKRKATIDEQTGKQIALDTRFTDSSGQEVTLRSMINKPTVLLPVFFRCTSICPLILGNLSSIVPEIGLRAGVDYQIITFSFDEYDTPRIAAEEKKNFTRSLPANFPKKSWHFLTGSKEEIKKLTDSAGFNFFRVENGFVHSTSLIILSPGGKISRYLHGTRQLPFDLELALNEAQEGKTGISVRRLVSLCYSYDSKTRRYGLNLLSISGIILLFGIFIFILFLAIKKKQDKT